MQQGKNYRRANSGVPGCPWVPPGSAKEREDRATARARGTKNPDELPLSVPGQVERLIKEATADTNLCRMYIGWTPFL